MIGSGRGLAAGERARPVPAEDDEPDRQARHAAVRNGCIQGPAAVPDSWRYPPGCRG